MARKYIKVSTGIFKYELADGDVRFCIFPRTAQGKQICEQFKTEREAKKRKREIEERKEKGKYFAPNQIPFFGDLAKEWIDLLIADSTASQEYGLSSATLYQYQSHIDHIKFSFGDRRADQISATDIKNAQILWQKPKSEGGRSLSIKTVRKVLTTMSRVFRYGMNKNLVSEDPTKLQEKIRGRRKLKDPLERTEQAQTTIQKADRYYKILRPVTKKEVLTQKELQSLILATEPGLHRTLIHLEAHTGMRVSEILALKWTDFSFKTDGAKVDRVAVSESLSTAKVRGVDLPKYQWVEPKSENGIRTIPLTPSLVKALLEWREKCRKNKRGLVFSQPDGNPIDRGSVGKRMLKPALLRGNIKKQITPHRLRHTFASLLLQLGKPIIEVQAYLGHADPLITARVYSHFIEDPEKPKSLDVLESGVIQKLEI